MSDREGVVAHDIPGSARQLGQRLVEGRDHLSELAGPAVAGVGEKLEEAAERAHRTDHPFQDRRRWFLGQGTNVPLECGSPCVVVLAKNCEELAVDFPGCCVVTLEERPWNLDFDQDIDIGLPAKAAGRVGWEFPPSLGPPGIIGDGIRLRSVHRHGVPGSNVDVIDVQLSLS